MQILWVYLKRYWGLLVLALFLAAVNQIFSLLDPWIFQHVLDNYVTKISQFTTAEFFRGVGLLMAAAVGAALVSRIAKNFQDYYLNTIIQKLGAKIYTDGLQHSLKLPYSIFEDQRSGETLGILQQVRLDVQNLITASVNTVFTSAIGFLFVGIYALSINWAIALAFILTVPLIGTLSYVLSARIKIVAAFNRRANDCACRINH